MWRFIANGSDEYGLRIGINIIINPVAPDPQLPEWRLIREGWPRINELFPISGGSHWLMCEVVINSLHALSTMVDVDGFQLFGSRADNGDDVGHVRCGPRENPRKRPFDHAKDPSKSSSFGCRADPIVGPEGDLAFEVRRRTDLDFWDNADNRYDRLIAP